MKVANLPTDEKQESLEIMDLENFLDVYQSSDGQYFYNLNSALYVKMNKANLLTHVVRTATHWPIISYQLFSSTRLAWLLMQLNDVDPRKAFDVVVPGTIVYFPSQEVILQLIQELNS